MKTRFPKPRVPFCWWCGWQLYAKRFFREVDIAGTPRVVHIQCVEPAATWRWS